MSIGCSIVRIHGKDGKPVGGGFLVTSGFVARIGTAWPNAHTSRSGAVYGVDWSGAKRAGDKIWAARLDPVERAVINVARPWQGQGVEDAVPAVSNWIGGLKNAWVGIDAPFGLALDDRQALIDEVEAHPRHWAERVIERYPDRQCFIDAVVDEARIGRHKRTTDKLARSPFAPTLLQMIYQTYATFQMLSHVDHQHVRILPCDHGRSADVTLIESCPAVLLKALGLSNQGYKLKPGSDTRRRFLLSEVSGRLGWRVDDATARLVEEDKEGDALDAILCGMATTRTAMIGATPIAETLAHEEGWIYV